LDDDNEKDYVAHLYRLSGDEFQKPSEILQYYIAQFYNAAK